MDRGAWWATVHGVTESWTKLTFMEYLPLFPLLFAFICTSVGYTLLALQNLESYVSNGRYYFCAAKVVVLQ